MNKKPMDIAIEFAVFKIIGLVQSELRKEQKDYIVLSDKIIRIIKILMK